GPTMTLGWQVLAAARARETGADVKTILEKIDRVRKRLVQFVAMDTLEYLQKGGRIGGAVKWAGGLLHVKPLISINHETGLVEPVSLARTHKSLVENMYKKFFEKLDTRKKLHLAVLHGNALDKAEELAARIKSEYNPVELIINMTGPVLGINTGPGALALCGYYED
ncbi:MAG: DegV family EDD domain-containing protein, partial [Anaerolineaceae bacterium]|nr:DegV family EDD domain-containing protein [Anaerolineaceae bacterium]